MRPLAALALAAALLPMLLAGCSGGPQQVSLADNRFEPSSLSLRAGDTVRFTNNGQVSHTVTIHDPGGVQALDQTLKPGETVDYTFAKPGAYHVFCRFHATRGMEMSVTIQ